MACEPSVLPLSAMRISPRTPERWMPEFGFFNAARERFRLVEAGHQNGQLHRFEHGGILIQAVRFGESRRRIFSDANVPVQRKSRC